MDRKFPTPEVDRRKFLQTAGSVTSAGAFVHSVETASASEQSLKLGKIAFVETLLRFEGNMVPDTHGDGGLPNHITVPDSNRITLVESNPDDFRKNQFITTFRGRYRGSDETLGGKKRQQVISDRDFGQRNQEVFFVDDEFSEPRFKVRNGANNVEVIADHQEMTVSKSEEAELQLEEIDLKRKDKTVNLTPVLGVRNHGQCDVYGKRGAWVLPLESDIPRIQLAVERYRRSGEEDEDVNTSSTDDFLIVELTSNR